MRYLILLSMIFILFISPALANKPWQDVVATINQEIEQNQQEINNAKDIIEKDHKQLSQDLSDIKKHVSEDEKSLSVLKKEFDALLQQEEKLRLEIETQESQIQTFMESLKTTAKDLDNTTSSLQSFSEYPNIYQNLDKLLDAENIPSMDDVENMTNIFFQLIDSSKQIKKYQGTIIDEYGKETQAEILRIGEFTSFYKKGRNVGYLRPDNATKKLAVIPGDLPWSVKKAIKNYFNGNKKHVPIDITGGIIVDQLTKSTSIKALLESGGVLVWPIIIIAFVAIIISCERLYFLVRTPTATDSIMLDLYKFISKEDWQSCKDLCKNNNNTPTCNVLINGFNNIGQPREVLENALEENMLKEIPRLERFLSTLSILAAMAPLLGLLGTVTGMIHTFHGITIFGTSDPKMMSGGISEALITTQLGLAVAIPIMIAHHFFDRRVEKIMSDMEEKATALLTVLVKN